jgi:hypothetical protein
MKTVAAISFRDNHSVSMDIEGVSRIESSVPMQVDGGVWCSEVLIRTANGTVALQLTASTPDKLHFHQPELE